MDAKMQLAMDRRSTRARDGAASLRCTTARRRETLELAFRLIYERYYREGLSDWSPHGLRILPHQLLDTTWVLLAHRRRQFCGTLSLIEDGAMGLPIEQLYPAEIWRLRRQERRVAELACFALMEGTAGENMSVLRALLKSACRIAADNSIDELVICVHPRRATFYERRLGFEEFGPLRCCPWVCGQPAVAMRLVVHESMRTAAVVAKPSPVDAAEPLAPPSPLRLKDRAYFLRLLESEPAWCSRRKVAA